MNTFEVEKSLISYLTVLDDVWLGKKVVISPAIYGVQTFGFGSLIFVPESGTKKKNWSTNLALSKPDLGLTTFSVTEKENLNKYAVHLSNDVKSILTSDLDKNLFFTVGARLEGLKVYFDFGWDPVEAFLQRQKNIMVAYGLEHWRTIAYAIIEKFATFKGNQTYGGSQYRLNIGDVYLFGKNTIQGSPKSIQYAVESMILYIQNITETDTTEFKMTPCLSPFVMAVELHNNASEWWPKTTINEFIIQNSKSLVDYSIVASALLLALNKIKMSIIVPIHDFLKDLLRKVQDENYTYTDLYQMYNWFGGNTVLGIERAPPFIEKIVNEIIEWYKMSSAESKGFNYDYQSSSRRILR
jgi:hypothetical protein